MSSSTERTFTLRTEDGEEFEIDESAVTRSGTLRLAIENREANDTFLVPKVTESTILVPKLRCETLCKVMEYCEKHAETDQEIKKWDANFVKVELSTLYDWLMAANWLDIKDLIELISHTIDNKLERFSPRQETTYDIQGR